jgi:hypothetical protein
MVELIDQFYAESIELRVLGLPWTLKTEIRDYRDRLF